MYTIELPEGNCLVMPYLHPIAVQCLMLWIEILAEYRRKRALRCAMLGVDVDAAKGAIKQASRKLALKWHTDRNKEDGAQEIMQKINTAKAFLLP